MVSRSATFSTSSDNDDSPDGLLDDRGA